MSDFKSLIKDMNRRTTFTGDWFIVVMVCVEPVTMLIRGENRRMMLHWSLDSPEQLWNSQLFLLLNWLPYESLSTQSTPIFYP